MLNISHPEISDTHVPITSFNNGFSILWFLCRNKTIQIQLEAFPLPLFADVAHLADNPFHLCFMLFLHMYVSINKTEYCFML